MDAAALAAFRPLGTLAVPTRLRLSRPLELALGARQWIAEGLGDTPHTAGGAIDGPVVDRAGFCAILGPFKLRNSMN